MKQKRRMSKLAPEVEPKFEEIRRLLGEFCSAHLNSEYLRICTDGLTRLATRKPCPILAGQARVWACSLIYAIGQANFLFDPTQNPHVTSKFLRDFFHCAESTICTKGGLVADLLDISFANTSYLTSNSVDQNPMAWLIRVDGMVVDARMMPREVQQEAYSMGLIPYVHDVGRPKRK